jgi:hypothetical protein
MEQRERGPGTTPHRRTGAGKSKPRGRVEPGEAEEHRKTPPGIPGDDTGASAEARQPEPSEDFGGRRDIETADEAPEQHDRRHHDRDPSDVESGQPV